MRSEICAATPRSWVISTMLQPISSRRRCSSRSTCACTVTSRAVVGSSAMMSSGSPAIAIAIITRCRSPPDSSCGKRAHPPLRVRDPDGGEQAQRLLVAACRLGDLPADPHGRVQRRHRVLEHRAEVEPAHFAQRLGVEPGVPLTMSEPATRTVPSDFGVLGQQPQHGEPENAFAGAGFADQSEDLPRRDRQRDSAQRVTSLPLRRKVTRRSPMVATGSGAAPPQRRATGASTAEQPMPIGALPEIEGGCRGTPCAAACQLTVFTGAQAPMGVAGVTKRGIGNRCVSRVSIV